MTETLRLCARTGFGLESIVSRELKALGHEQLAVSDGVVRFEGDLSAICRANIRLRTADRIQIEVGSFEALDFGILFDRTNELPWERWVGRNGEFPVTGRSVRSQLHSVPDCQRIVKKAIVERLKSVYGVAWCDESGPKYPIEVSMLKDVATLTIDTSGSGLHKRGYRKLTAQAPLRETLAAALVQLSVWNRDRPFVDAFCGSGTIVVEAAMKAINRAPGISRDFAASAWPQISESLWKEARDEARSLELPNPDQILIGTDRDADVLSLARYHARQAGVEDFVHFQQQPFSDFRSQKKYGCLISNPPYGERIGDKAEVEQLYRSMPKVLDPYDTWSFFVMAADSQFESMFGRKATRRRKLYNAKIACTYYQFLGPRPPRRG